MTTLRRDKAQIWNTDFLLLRPLHRLILDKVASHVAAGGTIIDLGCGSMPYKEEIRAMGRHYVGADITTSADIEIGPDGRVAMADRSADALLSVQVLEHVRNLDIYCAEMNRLMRDDATLILSTHGTWLYHPHPEDHRRWTRTGLIVDLADRGFRVDEIIPIAGPLATTTILRLAGFAFVLRKLPLLGPLMAYGLAILMNIRAMIEDWITPAQMRLDNACIYLVCARKAPA